MEKDIYYKGYKIKIRQDEDYESLNDWKDENLFLVYDHRQFTVKIDGFEPNDIYNYLELKSKIASPIGLDESQEELEDEIKGYFDYDSKYWIFPVEAYIHSGVDLSLFSGTKKCRWDSSVTGYILASKEEFKNLETATNAAEELIKTWNQYLSGDVWGYIIKKSNIVYSISKEKFDRLLFENDLSTLESEFDIEDEWEEVYSCWGFYGQDAVIEEAKLIIDNEYNNLNK